MSDAAASWRDVVEAMTALRTEVQAEFRHLGEKVDARYDVLADRVSHLDSRLAAHEALQGHRGTLERVNALDGEFTKMRLMMARLAGGGFIVMLAGQWAVQHFLA